MESALLYLGNVISQYFLHVEPKIEEFIIESVVRRIYKIKMPSIVQSLVLMYSRLLILYPEDLLKFLIRFQVENKAGLKVLIDKWLLHQPLFRGHYFKNISIKALTLIYSLKNDILESLMVIGYDPSHSNASVEVNAPLKILSTLVRCLNNEILQERMKFMKNDYENLDYEDNLLQNGYEDEQQIGDEDRLNNDLDIQDNDEKDEQLNINMDEFKNIQEDPKDSKLNFLNTQGRGGGLNNMETGSEVYLSEMLVIKIN